MPHHQDANAFVGRPVDERVREHLHGVNAAIAVRRRPEPRVLIQKLRNPPKFVEEASGQTSASLTLVETQGLREVVLGSTMEGVAQASAARSRAITSAPGRASLTPDSISASRFAANESQAASRCRSASRLAITRSSNFALSDGERPRTSPARVSMGSVMGLPPVLRCASTELATTDEQVPLTPTQTPARCAAHPPPARWAAPSPRSARCPAHPA